MAAQEPFVSLDKLKQVVAALLAVPKREVEEAEAKRAKRPSPKTKKP